MKRHLTALALAAGLLLAAAACGAEGLPPPSAGEMNDVLGALVLRGAALTDQVAGDAGCSEPALQGNAVRIDVRMPDEPLSRSVYLFRWRRAADFEADADAFARCVTEHGFDAVTVEDSPWRAYGSGWSEALTNAVEAALAGAAGP